MTPGSRAEEAGKTEAMVSAGARAVSCWKQKAAYPLASGLEVVVADDGLVVPVLFLSMMVLESARRLA
jgi:hypothetical protein